MCESVINEHWPCPYALFGLRTDLQNLLSNLTRAARSVWCSENVLSYSGRWRFTFLGLMFLRLALIIEPHRRLVDLLFLNAKLPPETLWIICSNMDDMRHQGETSVSTSTHLSVTGASPSLLYSRNPKLLCPPSPSPRRIFLQTPSSNLDCKESPGWDTSCWENICFLSQTNLSETHVVALHLCTQNPAPTTQTQRNWIWI